MKRKRIWSFVILLALVLSLTDGLSASPMKEVSAAGGKKQTTEKILIPEEKYWKYEENESGTVCITGFDDLAVYTYEKSEYDDKKGITYKLVIPQTIAGKKVTRVGGDSNFYDTYRMITSIKIPEGVTAIKRIGEYSIVSVELPSTLEEIGEYAFWSDNDTSSSLSSIAIPAGVKYIGYGAFMECDKLKSIHLPAGLKEIDDQAFYGCWSLQNIVIPASVEYIDEQAFADCRGMTAYKVEPNNKGDYCAEDGILYKKWIDEVPVYGNQVDEDGDLIVEYYKNVEMKKLISYPGSKKGVCNLTANMNFSWTAFLNCKGLTAINVASENPYYSSVDGVIYEKDMKTLDVCPAGKTGEYTVPEGVRSIQTNSFSNSALHTIHLPDSLEEKYTNSWGNEENGFIGDYSFYQCNNLQTITVGKGATEEIVNVLLGTVPNLKNISISDKNPTLCAVDNIIYDKMRKKLLFVPAGRKGRLVLPDTVESSNRNICGTGITKLVLGKNYRVTEKKSVDDDGVQEYIVRGLPRLENLQSYEVASANNKLVSYDGVLYSKDLRNLYHCPPQKKGTVTIPKGTVVIWDDAFSDCYDIGTIKGYTGSAAEVYAKTNNIKFISLGTIAGKKKKNQKKKTSAAIKKPKKVSLKKVKALGKRKVKVTWKRLTGVRGYQLQYAKNKKFKKAKSKAVTKTSYTIKKLKKKKTYYFRVRAYKLSGKKKIYGKWSKVKKCKVKK